MATEVKKVVYQIGMLAFYKKNKKTKMLEPGYVKLSEYACRQDACDKKKVLVRFWPNRQFRITARLT